MMRSSSSFGCYRFYLCLKRDIALNRSAITIFAVTLAIFLFVYGMLFTATASFHYRLFSIVLYLGGILVTSKSFRELHDKNRSYQYFMLPASNFEKFLAKLVLTTIGYMVGLIICFFIVSLIIAGIYALAVNHQQPIFQFWSPHILNSIYGYLIVQAIFLLGASYFKTHQIAKTFLAILGVVIVFSIAGALLSVPSLFGHWFAMGHFIGGLLRVVVTIIIAPSCWVVAYLRLTEAEV